MTKNKTNPPQVNITGYIPLPERREAPALGVSIESLGTMRKMSKVKKLGYVIPKGKNILDVIWVPTYVWYKPTTWGKGYFTTKNKTDTSQVSMTSHIPLPVSITGYMPLPEMREAPALGVSIESLETMRKMSKVKKLGYVIPKNKNILDVIWIPTYVWYKPTTWGKGYFTTK